MNDAHSRLPESPEDVLFAGLTGSLVIGEPLGMRRYDLVPKARGKDGWFGGRPPGISSDSWPRSRNNGLPMVHVATIRLPDEYRRQGAHLVAISIFEALDFETSDIDGASDILEGRPLTDEEKEDPYLRSLALAARSKHPEERFYVDDVVGDLTGFAVLWLTLAEFEGKPASPPKKVIHEALEDAPCAWDTRAPKQTIAHVPVEDPNAGKSYRRPSRRELERALGSEELPSDEAEPEEGREPGGYVPFCSLPGEVQAVVGYATHLGGTLSDPVNVDLPEDLSPYVLELGEVGPANMPRGNFYIDLETRAMALGR